MITQRRRIASHLSVMFTTLTAILTLGITVGSEAAPPGVTLPNVSVLGTNSVRIQNSAQIVAGHVVVNNALSGPSLTASFELGIGGTALTPAGYAIVADSIQIAGGAVVGGNAFFNNISNAGTINGTQNSPLSLPVFSTLPTFKSTVGALTGDVTVPKNGTQTIAPGNFRDITVRSGATLNFGQGTYNVRSITVENAGKLLFQNLSSGNTEVRVANQLTTSNGSIIGPSNLAASDASKIVFYVAFTTPAAALTPAAVSIGNSSTVLANLYAQNGTLVLGNGTNATGAFMAKNLDVGNSVHVDLRTFFNSVPPVADSQSVSTGEDTPKAITLSASDVDSPSLTFTIVSPPAHGGLSAIVPISCSPPPAGGATCTASVTYTPAANFNGNDSFTFKASDGFGDSNVATVSITVNAVADAPVANSQSTSTAEETTKQITLSGTDPDGDTLTFAIVGGSGPSHGTLGAITPVLPCTIDVNGASTCTATVDYTPATNFNGNDSFTFTVNDGTSTSAPGTVSITVTNTNDAPVAAGQSVTATTGVAKTITLSATDADGDNLTFTTVDAPQHGSLGAIVPISCIVDASGTSTCTADVSYTANNPPGYTGPDSFTFKATDTFPVDSNVATVNITVNPANVAPVLTAGGTLNYTENQAATAIDTTITITDSDSPNLVGATVQITGNCASGQDVLSFVNTASITGTPGSCSLTLSGTDTVANYQTALRNVKYNNTSDNPSTAARTVTWQVNDGGATNNLSNTATSTINVTAVNDAPVLTAGGVLNYTENQAATVIDGGVTVNDADSTNLASATVQITVGCANTQDVLGFVNTATITGVYTQASCSMSLTGVDSLANYQAALRSVTYHNTSENPSTAARTVTWIGNDGTNASSPVTSTINVTPVNDAPVLTAGGTLNYTENQAATAIDTTITVTDVDSTNLVGATVQITGNCASGEDVLSFVNTATITGTPGSCSLTLSGTDTLANYQTALRNVKYSNTSENPSAAARTVTWQVNDGGAANNLSNTATSTINVTPVNDAPVAQPKNGGNVQANMKRNGINASLLTGATDPDNGINGCVVNFSVASITSGTGGTASNVDLVAGTFDFEPTAGFTGNATVNYTISDNASDAGDGCPGPTATSAPATITLNVVGPVIWFVDAVSGSDANSGRLGNPFQTLTAANAVDASGHRIFLYTGTYSTGLTLNTDEWLIGQGVTGTSFDSYFGITPPTGTIARPSINGTRPTVQGTVTLNTNSRVGGLNLSTGASTGMNDPAGAITGATVSEVAVTTTTGTGVLLSDVAGTFTFTGLTTTGGTGANLTGSNGSATFNFSNVSVAIGSGANPGFVATGGGTLNITGSTNTISTFSGTALNVSNTTIGASGLTFQSISAGNNTGDPDPANGIVLNTTGALGGLTVTAGGTIQHTTSHGIALTSTRDVSLNQMNIQSTGGSGVSGVGVTNFTFTNGTVNNSGDAVGEANIAFNGNGSLLGNNFSGTLTITGSTLTNAFDHGIHVEGNDGTVANAVITGNTITSTTSNTTSKGSGIQLVGAGTAATVSNLTKATISNNTIRNFPAGAGIQVIYGNTNAAGPAGRAGTAGSLTDIVSITNNTVRGFDATNRFNTDAIAISINGGNSALRSQGNFDVSNNGTVAEPIGNSSGTVILIGNNGFATMTATVNNNVIVGNNINSSPGIGGGNGIVIGCAAGTCETPDLTLTASGNDISATDGNGILLVGRGNQGTAKLSVKNNTVDAPLGGVRPGIRVDAGNGTAVTEDEAVCLDISGNTSAGSGGSQGIGLRKQGTNSTVNDFGIEGMAATSSPGVEAFVNGQNPAGGGTLLISATSGFSNCNTAP